MFHIIFIVGTHAPYPVISAKQSSSTTQANWSLRTFARTVSAHQSLLRKQIHMPRHTSVRKNEENLSIRSLNFVQNVPSNSVSNASWRVKFCENVGNIWNYLRNRPTSTKYD